jgi:Fic family protein
VNHPTGRTGRYVWQPSGYRAFIPAPLPPDPPLAVDLPLSALLSRADLALGRLDGVTSTLPDPDLFVAMFVRQEAVFSSQIEGTQSSLDDVLVFELDPEERDVPADVSDVVNHVRAMNYGLERLETLPLSLRLIREIHAILLEETRGAERRPGKFRTSQNWIGPGRVTLADATVVPPPPSALMETLGDFEHFLDAAPRLWQWPGRAIAHHVSALPTRRSPAPRALSECVSEAASHRVLPTSDGGA